MTNHYVFEAEFCDPASGGEKCHVEKNVQDSRPRLWLPTPNFLDMAALNAWLEQRCMELWREVPHGVLPSTNADVWTEEQAALMPLPQAFYSFVEKSKRVSPTCLISFDRNRYSVPASFANRPVSLRIGSIRLGSTVRPGVVMQGEAAAQRAQVDVTLLYSIAPGPLKSRHAHKLAEAAATNGVRLVKTKTILIHGKFVAVDDDDLTITSFNWASASSDPDLPEGDVGVRIQLAGIAR